MNIIDLSIFSSRINAICAEMGAVLKRAAFSPNIKDRLDFSCAIFNQSGELCAQAAHIPVHLGSMAYAMKEIVKGVEWAPGDMIILNDPYLGGTHLPDVTLISSVFYDSQLMGFVVNRAHHADIGAETPGSMPVSRHLNEEGILIAPQHLLRRDKLNQALLHRVVNATSHPRDSLGDFNAQISANRVGLKRLLALVEQSGVNDYLQGLIELNDYAHRLASSGLHTIPEGCYQFTDYMDDDGAGHTGLPIRVAVTVKSGDIGRQITVDFSATVSQVEGNINCPLSVTAAAVFYVFRCLMPEQTPSSSGAFSAIKIRAPEGCLLNAKRPAAVAAGNVETSSRIVDVLLGALHQAIPDKIPAASHGTMNNLAMGANDEPFKWSYYETLGGGMGAGLHGGGLSALQTHMTNTLNTPIEVLETKYPLVVRQYRIRRDSGGKALHPGGDGLVRQYEFLAPATVTLLTERRINAPWGLKQGGDGKPGINELNSKQLAAKTTFNVKKNDLLTIKTPGGGGYGKC